MPQNLVEKIAQRFAVGVEEGHTVRSGDFVSIRPAHVMTHDNTAAVIPKFTSMGAARVFDPPLCSTLAQSKCRLVQGNRFSMTHVRRWASVNGGQLDPPSFTYSC